MRLKCRLEDWLSLRPVIVHVYQGPVPKIGRDAVNREPGNNYVWLLLQGSVIVERQGSRIEASAGSWVIAHPGVRWQKFSDDAEVLSIQFQATWPDGMNLFEQGLSIHFPSSRYPDVTECARQLFAASRSLLPNDTHAIRKTLLTLDQYLSYEESGLAFLRLLFAALVQEGIQPARVGLFDERLLAALRKLEHWPLDRSFDAEWLARTTGISERRLVQLFTDAFNTTPNVYLQNRRLSYARKMLGHSSVAIKVIAMDLGFLSLADFSRWFKRNQTISPRQYRNSTVNLAHL